MERKTTCNRDCPDSCAIVVNVEDGKATRHVGDRSHAVTRGFLCSQGRDYLKRQYHAERIIHPQRRTAAGWQRISWDQALDTAAEQLLRVRTESGPLSVLALTYSGFRGHVQKTLAKLFWSHFGGATVARGGLSVEPIHAAQHRDFGTACTHAPEDLAHSNAIVIWGKNPVVTRQHWIPFLDEARKNGAKVFVIDPIPSATARRADRHFALRPGTDRLVAVGIARVLVDRDCLDFTFIDRHTSGFDAWRDKVLSCSLRELSVATDLPIAAIEELAEVYGSIKPVSTHVGLGACYWTHGGETVRFIDALAAVTGNLGISGGGVWSDNVSPIENGTIVPPSLTRTVRLPMLGDDMLATVDPPLRVGWVAGANPAATAPDTRRVREALGSLDYLVVVDQFMTATSECAHLFLPCTTYLETDDVITAYGHHWVGLSRRVLEPQGEARSDAGIYQALAGRLGFGPALEGSAESWIRRVAGPALDHEQLQQGAVENPLAKRVPLADGKFGTPSGRFEFVATLTPHVQSEELHLVAAKSRRMINSQVLSEDLSAEPSVRVHPSVLAARSLQDGGWALVSSAVGKVRVKLTADAALRTDVVVFGPARWRQDLSGVNQLREARVTDLGCGAAMHETRVKLEPVS